ncbi:Crp/Fnr family transcriptional regulator [Pacificibacter marinus]|uniref:Transcriptional activatory protein AadR n=1 Tax=Pacificibacter marinus TaxID=658057 RepID=A0A1Y5SXX9_9RHOB|nr:cyclic nucleotide-binding domain-containing protein [Pacificibacter marinus]SEK84409.1 transcriptional regulator, Crp/Fnr family [Pacificibacter marinus]SLN49032.1 Transcriptional activatory protein AadR [Pacificibacter marinus]
MFMHSKSEGSYVPATRVVRATKTSPLCENLSALFRKFPAERHYQPQNTILLHGDTADAVYRVISGTVRCCTIDEDGGRQIFSFQKKGDFIGMSDVDAWHFTAEAVDHVIVQSVPRASLEQELAMNFTLRMEMRYLINRLLIKREHQILSLISHKAPQRLLNFLREFATTRSSSGFTVLPMCRRDIADHLGMTTETTSRAFGVLKNSGAIEMTTPDKYRLLD